MGDCYEEPGDDPTDVVEYPAERGEPYPGRRTIVRYAGDPCLDGIVAYLGMPFEESPLADYEIVPTRASGDGGNRRVTCALRTEDGSPLVGSQRSRRAG